MPMTPEIERFVAGRRLAVVGVSRSGKGFGVAAYRELRRKGLQLTPVHPSAAAIEGDAAAPSLAALPQPVDGVLVVVPPERAVAVVREAAAAGIPRVWLQQGAESDAAIAAAAAAGIEVVAGECILMYAEPAGLPHRVHRWLKHAFARAR